MGTLRKIAMTKEEAIEQMKQGKKVRHRYFGQDEWIAMKSDFTIVTEEGYHCDANEFWSWRKSKSWNTDWELIEEE